MSSLSNVLKAAAVACVTIVPATAATAEEIVVRVYEKGFLPNIGYLGDATSVRFVNETDFTLGLDYESGGIMVNSFTNEVVVSVSDLSGKPLREPYVFTKGYYDGKGFSVSTAEAPNG